jgi:DNA-binding CsgD family transcriptional regulator
VSYQLLNRQPVEDRPKLTLSYDFHLNNCGQIQLINHRMTPLVLAPNGQVWLTLCFVSMSNHDEPGNVIIRKQGESGYWSYDLDLKRWIRKPDIVLSDAEKEVLLLSAQGYTIEAIANASNRAKDTIKSRRRAIFEKLGVKSTTN